MSLSRRRTLALIGGGTIFAAAAAVGYDITRLPRDGLSPETTSGYQGFVHPYVVDAGVEDQHRNPGIVGLANGGHQLLGPRGREQDGINPLLDEILDLPEEPGDRERGPRSDTLPEAELVLGRRLRAEGDD